jgi:hypothetical protein
VTLFIYVKTPTDVCRLFSAQKRVSATTVFGFVAGETDGVGECTLLFNCRYGESMALGMSCRVASLNLTFAANVPVSLLARSLSSQGRLYRYCWLSRQARPVTPLALRVSLAKCSSCRQLTNSMATCRGENTSISIILKCH